MQEYYISRTFFCSFFGNFTLIRLRKQRTPERIFHLQARPERICHLPARPERAEAPSPGHRPGYSGFYEYALKGQKFYKQLKLEII